MKYLLQLFFSMLSIKTLTSPPNLGELIKKYSTKYNLSSTIVSAVVYQESRGEQLAFRFEEAFYERYVADKSRATLLGYVPPASSTPNLISEKRARAVSWGYMQIMGQTARENGFNARWLPSLFTPEHNLDMGCKLLKKFLDQYDHLPEEEAYRKALLRYNGGANLGYPDMVFAHIDSGDYKKILSDKVA